MKLTVILILIWNALTAGCYFPFNNPHLANETLLAEVLAKVNLADNGGSGYMNTIERGFKDSPRQTLPARGSPPVAFVLFRYAGQGSKDRLKDRCKSLNQCPDCTSATSTNHNVL